MLPTLLYEERRKPDSLAGANKTRSSESDGRSDVTDSLDCPDKFRVP